MDRFRSATWALRCRLFAALALLVGFALLWVPADGSVGAAEVSVRCGSVLQPVPQLTAYACDDPHRGFVLAATLLLALALVLLAIGHVAAGERGDDRPRQVLWAAAPVAYFVVVTGAALFTYPFVVESRASAGYLSGLEYLAQLMVGFPLAILGLAASQWSSDAGAVLGMYLAGLVQVGLLAWFCLRGYRRSQRRSEDWWAAPVT